MDAGTIANIDIQCVILRHTKQKKLTYQEEMEYLSRMIVETNL